MKTGHQIIDCQQSVTTGADLRTCSIYDPSPRRQTLPSGALNACNMNYNWVPGPVQQCHDLYDVSLLAIV